MTLRLPQYENIFALGDFNLTSNTTSSIKISTSGNSTPDITLTGSGGGSTTNTGILELDCSEFLIPAVSDWTKSQAVDSISSDSRYIQLASTSTQNVSTPLTFSGEINVPTVEVGDNSTKAASTAFVYDSFHAIEGSVSGDISTSGSSITLLLGDSGIQIVFAYTGTGTASITFSATSDSISPVDIRRNSIYSGSGVETFTLDGGTLTTTGTVVDDTVYTASNDSSAYFIRVNGTVYFLTVWASGNGARAFMGFHKMI